MPDSPAKFYLTTPIYYVNARPHIGHAYTTIVADVLARRSRSQGTPTWFLTGTDEHGQKIERSAQAAGIPPQAFADEVSQSFQTLWQRMGITNDQYIRTSSDAHKRGVQKLFTDLHAKGQIYLSSYTGQYSIGEEMFVEGPPGTLGPDGKPTETVTEENFFFRLSAYQLPLIDLIESDTLKITPEARKNEVLSFLRGPVSSSSDTTKNAVILSEARSAQSKDGLDRASSGPSESLGNRQDPEVLYPAQTVQTISTETPSGPIPTPTHPLDPIEPTGPNDLGPSPSHEPEPTTSAPTSGLAFSKLGHPYVPGSLRDLSVSRSSFSWGIPVPEPAASEAKEKHVIYVWLDALANYMTAVGYGDDSPQAQAQFAKFWPADLHLVGKEIIRFHCVYWPAFLLAAGLPLPKAVTAHGWLLFDDSKMSKSKGNIVRTETILSAFGTLCPPPPVAPSEVMLKGTPSGVPSSSSAETTASAAEVRSPIPATQSPGAPFIAQPHREMSGTTASNPAPTGAPSSDDGGAGEQGGVSDEVRPFSFPPAQSQKGGSSGLKPAEPTATGEGASAPAIPTPQQRDLFAADVLRYFLLREIPFGQDGSFTFEALITRYNADLANGYGNLVSRTLKMIQDNFAGEIPIDTNFAFADSVEEKVRFAEEGPAAIVVHHVNRCVRMSQSELLQTVFNVLLGELNLAITVTDKYLSENAPWKLAKLPGKEAREKLTNILATAAESIRIITALLHPILPYATAAVWRQLGLGDIELTTKNQELRTLTWGGLKPGTKLGPLAPIFPRADKGLAQTMADIESSKNEQNTSLTGQRHETPAPEPTDPTHPGAGPRTSTLAEPNPGTHVAGSAAHTTERPGTPSHTEASASGIFGAPFIPEPHPGMSGSAPASGPVDASPQKEDQITIDDFAKVELRVAQILVCERIPKADKLLRLEVDLGYEQRQILSGIAEWYTPEDLIGRRIVVITNLAPRKMRGLESHGMLLAASTEGGKPHLATFAEADDLPLGSRLK